MPWSVVVHLVALAVLAAWGGHVPQPPLEPQRVLRVQIARMPAAEPQVSQPAPQPEPEPAIPETEPPPQNRPQEQVLPEKEVPRQPEPEPAPERADPQPKSVRQEPETPAPVEPDSEVPATPVASGPAVSGTDVDFPFAWYLNSVEGIIARNWKPRQLGFREGSSRGCVVHFMIDRSGQVAQVALVKSSGVALFDREALRAVKSGRLPPLPAKFPHRALGVTFVFTLESGM